MLYVTILNYQSLILLKESEIDLSSSSKRYNEPLHFSTLIIVQWITNIFFWVIIKG